MGPFRIETTTGKISLVQSPQLTNYTLTIRAADSGTCPGCPPQGLSLESETQVLSVEVIDKNLQAPQFTSCPPVFKLTELAVPSVIGKVSNHCLTTFNVNRENISASHKFTVTCSYDIKC